MQLAVAFQSTERKKADLLSSLRLFPARFEESISGIGSRDGKRVWRWRNADTMVRRPAEFHMWFRIDTRHYRRYNVVYGCIGYGSWLAYPPRKDEYRLGTLYLHFCTSIA